MNKLTKALAASALIGGAVFAAPLAANAATTYTPQGSNTCSTDTVAPGSTFTIICVSGTFEPGSALVINLSSTGAVPTNTTAAVFHAATATATGTANSNGGTTITGTVPSNATANISVTAADPTGNTGTGEIVLARTAPAGTTPAGTTPTTPLATTGTYISLATVWGAVGLVALGGGAIAVRQISRKRENNA